MQAARVMCCSMFFFAVIALALIAFAAPALTQEINCAEEFFRVSRAQDSCQAFFVCMIGQRVDFICDEGEIFDEVRIACRAGRADTCEYVVPPIPSDICEAEFLRLAPHPDPHSCHVFYACLNFNLITFRCNENYIFSDYAQRCVPGSHETCREEGLTPFVAPEFVPENFKRV